jgi:hypothetical protein
MNVLLSFISISNALAYKSIDFTEDPQDPNHNPNTHSIFRLQNNSNRCNLTCAESMQCIYSSSTNSSECVILQSESGDYSYYWKSILIIIGIAIGFIILERTYTYIKRKRDEKRGVAGFSQLDAGRNIMLDNDSANDLELSTQNLDIELEKDEGELEFNHEDHDGL